MRRTLKSNQRLIEPVGLPIGLGLTPIAGVTCESKKYFMAPNILRALIRITTTRSGCANKRQSKRLVIRFVRSILTVSQHCDAISTHLVGEIDPLVRSNLELTLFCIRPLNRADVPVVGGRVVRCAQWKSGFYICFLR